ncbi:MAG: hypothetical protein ACM3ME_01415, partial [Chloroflexota bacterium]
DCYITGAFSPLNPSGELSIFFLFFFVCSHNPSTASRSGEQKNQKKAAAGFLHCSCHAFFCLFGFRCLQTVDSS